MKQTFHHPSAMTNVLRYLVSSGQMLDAHTHGNSIVEIYSRKNFRYVLIKTYLHYYQNYVTL